MARIFTDGAEMGDMLFWDSYTSSVTNTSTLARSGNRCYMANANTQTAQKNITGISELYFRFGFRFAWTASAISLFAWRNGSTTLGSIRINAGNLLELYTSTGTLVATGSHSMQSNQWYLIELHILINDTTGELKAKIDGVLDSTFNGDTKPGTATTIDNILWTGNYGSTVMYVDDLALNDTSGPHDYDWCGDGRIVLQTVKSNGDITLLSRGGTDSGTNWNQVDETPSNGDTDYNESNTSEIYDLYNITTLSGLAVGETIQRVYVESRARETTAAGDLVAMGIKSNSVEIWATGIAPGTTYTRLVTSGWLVDPSTNLTWTRTSVSGLQIGFKVI